MANRTVVLIWIAKTGSGWKRFPVLIAKNGRIRTGVVLEDGVEKSYPDGRFQVRSFQGSKTVYENAGTDPTVALGVRDRLGRRKNVVAQAEEAGLEIRAEETQQRVGPTVIRYLKRLEDMEADEAVKSYAVALHSFQRLVPELEFMNQINEAALLRYTAALRKTGNSARTVANKHRAVTGMMRWAGVDVAALRLVKSRFEKKIASTYSDAEVEALLEGVGDDLYHRIAIDVLRMTGLREGEAIHLQWGDVDFDRKIIRVRSKPEFGHSIKDKEERDLPFPAALATVLTSWREQEREGPFVLGTAGGLPNKKLLRGIKRIARKAGLNCDQCKGCLDRGECRNFTLHAFRRLYATTLHRKGMDVRTLMAFLGHSDLETTLSYLAAKKVTDAQDMVSAAFA